MAQGIPAIVQSPAGDIVISQGATNDFGFVWTRDGSAVPIETDGWLLRAQIRKLPGLTPWLSLSLVPDADGSYIGANDSGEVVIHLEPATTEDPAWNSGARDTGVWDLEAHNPTTGETKRLVMGNVTVSHDVTREA